MCLSLLDVLFLLHCTGVVVVAGELQRTDRRIVIHRIVGSGNIQAVAPAPLKRPPGNHPTLRRRFLADDGGSAGHRVDRVSRDDNGQEECEQLSLHMTILRWIGRFACM